MVRKFICLLLAVSVCLCLCGCSFSLFDAKSLMAPPKANEDQQAIHALLQGSRQDVTFVYPKTGQYRSAIIMLDFTGDGVDDAIGFYALEDTGGVEVQFLTQAEGTWRTAASFRNTANQVDRVCTGDLTGTGLSSVLIGWGSAAGTTGRTASVSAYLWNGSEVEEYPLGVYGELSFSDLDGNGVSEVFTVDKFVLAENEGEEPTPAKARVFAWKNGTMQELWSANADNSVTSYSSAVFGRLSDSIAGMVLDGAKADGSMTTQVFYLRGRTLVSFPAGVNTEEYSNAFVRPNISAFYSRDIDGDGYIEIPRVSPLPCLPEDVTPDSTSYLAEWQSFQRVPEGSLTATALMNSGENYWFRLPPLLRGRITALNDSSRRTTSYIEVITSEDQEEKLMGSPLFSIRTFTRSAWESWGPTSGYELLAEQGDTIYGILAITQNKDLLKSVEQIKKTFQLLGE